MRGLAQEKPAYRRVGDKRIIIWLFVFLCGCSKVTPYTKDVLLMDTFVRIEIVDNLPIGRKRQALDSAVARMKELERRFDYFSEDSELSKLNSLKEGEKISLSPEMGKVFREAESLRKMTGGAFDIRGGPDKKINLGGIAKGFIVDEGIKVLKESGVKNALINAGGDMYCMGEGASERGWKIGIRSPEDSRRIIARFTVRDKGTATSGEYERPSHIIDPRRGLPVEKALRSVTVVAGDCITADGLATALYVLGPREGLSLIERIDGAECFIIDNGDTHISEGFPQIALTNS
ncbi:MAG: FAD:protein FMN transferase [Candidatus Omnitrophota bacterium]|nr:MAG: FAD:protein FMN transferase [Candidatus Omnitrophota bacterium]